MKSLHLLLFFTLFSSFPILAQLSYTEAEFEATNITDVNYGSAIDYAGTEVDLLLDIYKPVGDDNCQRPIMILAHGGAWVTDDKTNESLVFMSNELARRGWVVANINYRLGMNKIDDYTTDDFCIGITEPCAYLIDSMEVERANFRAMQDAKGAIRFMKSRSLIDSTDIENVFMAGESAGSFIAFSTGFTNTISKKPASCFEIDDVLPPDSDFEQFGCVNPENNLSRPDLGGIEGDLHTDGQDASLRGVGSFFGGVIDLNLFSDVTNPPSVYLYHQGSDVIIHYDHGQMFQRINDECFLGICQKYGPYPYAYGGEGIRKHFETLGTSAPSSFPDILDNMGGTDCFANGHAIDDPELRLQSMTNFFAEKIADSGNTPTNMCNSVGIGNTIQALHASISTNPVYQNLGINILPENIGASYEILNVAGKKMLSGNLLAENNSISVNDLPNGIYLVHISQQNKATILKLLKN